MQRNFKSLSPGRMRRRRTRSRRRQKDEEDKDKKAVRERERGKEEEGEGKDKDEEERGNVRKRSTGSNANPTKIKIYDAPQSYTPPPVKRHSPPDRHTCLYDRCPCVFARRMTKIRPMFIRHMGPS